MTLRRPLRLLAALLPLVATSAAAQPAPAQSQLDRIEGKLDELLRRLPARHADAPVAAPAGSSPAPAISAEYRPGALAVVHPAPGVAAPLAMPADTVGGFVFGGGTLRLDDLAGRGVRYRGLAGIELQGWLRVREEGRYQLAADFSSPRAGSMLYTLNCGVAAWLEDRQVGQRTGELNLSAGSPGTLSLVLGAELRPGLYRLRLWTGCGHFATPTPIPATLDLLIKSPSELNLRGLAAEDILHREG